MPSSYTALDEIDPEKGAAGPLFTLDVEHLDEVLEYKAGKDGLANSLYSKVSRPAGSHLCYITAYVPVPAATWYSVQSGKNSHIAMESGLTYSNHSCEPTVEFHTFSPGSDGTYARELPYTLPAGQRPAKSGPHGIAGEVRVSRDRDLQVGDELKWFYPSTEWAASTPFDCLCGAPKDVCIGNAAGSSTLPRSVLDRYHINPHIDELARERDNVASKTNGNANGAHPTNGVNGGHAANGVPA